MARRALALLLFMTFGLQNGAAQSLVLAPDIGLVDVSHQRARAPSNYAAADVAASFPDASEAISSGLFVHDGVVGPAFSPAHLWSLLIASVGMAIVVVFFDRGPAVYVPIIVYIAALSTMTIALRNCFANENFDFPRTVTALHFASTCLVSGVWMHFRRVMFGERITPLKSRSFFYGIAPTAVAFAASLAFSNIGIALTNAHFYEMVETSTPLITAAFAVVMGKTFPAILLLPLCVCVLGMMLCWSGEVAFSHLGLICLLIGAFGRAVKGVLNQIMLSGSEVLQQLHPVELVFYTSATCFVVMVPWAVVSESGQAPLANLANRDTFIAVLATVVNAIIINLSGTFVIKDLGAVGAQLVGNLKGVLSVMGSWALMHEVVTHRQVVGYAIMVTGIFVYNKMNMDLAHASREKDMEKQALLKGKGGV